MDTEANAGQQASQLQRALDGSGDPGQPAAGYPVIPACSQMMTGREMTLGAPDPAAKCQLHWWQVAPDHPAHDACCLHRLRQHGDHLREAAWWMFLQMGWPSEHQGSCTAGWPMKAMWPQDLLE